MGCGSARKRRVGKTQTQLQAQEEAEAEAHLKLQEELGGRAGTEAQGKIGGTQEQGSPSDMPNTRAGETCLTKGSYEACY